MLEDIRNHDAQPTPEETQWMATDIVAVVLRAAVLAAVALSVGLSTAIVIERAQPDPAVATRAPG